MRQANRQSGCIHIAACGSSIIASLFALQPSDTDFHEYLALLRGALRARGVLARHHCSHESPVCFYRLLLKNLDLVWSGKAWAVAKPQDEAAATHAAKLTRADSLLDWNKPAQALHNQVTLDGGSLPFLARIVELPGLSCLFTIS